MERREHIGSKPPPSRSQSWQRRLERMGIRARVMRGGRTVIATMPFSAEAFPALERTARFERVLFATVGSHHIKCLKPEAFFCLKMLDVRGCENARDVEQRIRGAWRAHIEQLGRTRGALLRVGAHCVARSPDTVLRVPIEGEGGRVQAYMVESGEVVLPSRGPLQGLSLRSRDERVLKLGAIPSTAIEFQIAITNRVEQLAAADRRPRDSESSFSAGSSHGELTTVGVRSHRILLVGPRLSRNDKAIESLRLRGYAIDVARNATDAIRLYQRCSPELVISDADLGRSEGLELVPMLEATVGVDHIPVIVVDEQHHAARRSAAREVGAKGYLAGPLKIARIAERLAKLLDAPERRRFTRYSEPVSVRLAGAGRPTTATVLSRGGLCLATDMRLPARSLHRCELHLATMGRTIEVEAEVLYQLGDASGAAGGLGLRFDRFGSDGESEYLNFLREIEVA